MSATFQWCEINGRAPGSPTTGVTSVNWKAVDDVTTPYTDPASAITAGTASYTKWNYGEFSGNYTTIANVKFTHQSGVLGPGCFLMCQKPMVIDADRLTYSTPSRMTDSGITPFDLSQVGSSVTVYVGPTDPGSSGKTAVGTNAGGTTLYTNFLVTQLQTTTAALPGDTPLVTLRLTYDEA